MPGVIERLRGVGLRSMISRIPHSRFQAHMTRAPFVVLCRAFFGRFFASESATSDEALRQAIVGVLAFILTPCLLILINVFPQFQLLVIRVGRVHPPPGVVVRATAVRNINAEDMLEWAVAILVAYTMVSIGLVAVWVWDALGFDRRDAMVLGPLPVRWTTIAAAKVAALAALLLGAATAVNLLNASVFALETSDQFGAGALGRHLVRGRAGVRDGGDGPCRRGARRRTASRRDHRRRAAVRVRRGGARLLRRHLHAAGGPRRDRAAHAHARAADGLVRRLVRAPPR